MDEIVELICENNLPLGVKFFYLPNKNLEKNVILIISSYYALIKKTFVIKMIMIFESLLVLYLI